MGNPEIKAPGRLSDPDMKGSFDVRGMFAATLWLHQLLASESTLLPSSQTKLAGITQAGEFMLLQILKWAEKGKGNVLHDIWKFRDTECLKGEKNP